MLMCERKILEVAIDEDTGDEEEDQIEDDTCFDLTEIKKMYPTFPKTCRFSKIFRFLNLPKW